VRPLARRLCFHHHVEWRLLPLALIPFFLARNFLIGEGKMGLSPYGLKGFIVQNNPSLKLLACLFFY